MTNMTHVDPMIQAILRADQLTEETRVGYCKTLDLIAAAARNKGVYVVLTLHPQKVFSWTFRSFSEVYTQEL